MTKNVNSPQSSAICGRRRILFTQWKYKLYKNTPVAGSRRWGIKGWPSGWVGCFLGWWGVWYMYNIHCICLWMAMVMVPVSQSPWHESNIKINRCAPFPLWQESKKAFVFGWVAKRTDWVIERMTRFDFNQINSATERNALWWHAAQKLITIYLNFKSGSPKYST